MAGDQPDAFPLKDQYVACIKNARNAPDDDHEAAEGQEGRPAKRARVEKQDPPAMPSADSGDGKRAKAWNYAAVRKEFIDNVRTEKPDCSYSDAVELWNASAPRRALLGSLSVVELKKRKFLPKGATVNPWAGDPVQGA